MLVKIGQAFKFLCLYPVGSYICLPKDMSRNDYSHAVSTPRKIQNLETTEIPVNKRMDKSIAGWYSSVWIHHCENGWTTSAHNSVDESHKHTEHLCWIQKYMVLCHHKGQAIKVLAIKVKPDATNLSCSVILGD